jgi:hypothetical protein
VRASRAHLALLIESLGGGETITCPRLAAAQQTGEEGKRGEARAGGAQPRVISCPPRARPARPVHQHRPAA